MLLDAYQSTTAQHSIALAELNTELGICSRSEYVEMYRNVESLRQEAAGLRYELEWHVQSTGADEGRIRPFWSHTIFDSGVRLGPLSRG